MKKSLNIFRIMITLFFLAITILWVLFTLNEFKVINLNFSMLKIPQINNIREKHPYSLYLILAGGSVILIYMSVAIWISKIPILGFLFKMIFGSIMILIGGATLGLGVAGAMGYILFL